MEASIDSGRIEKRHSLSVPVRLWRVENPIHTGKIITENVSAHGLRIRVKQSFRLGEEVVIASSGFTTLAQVVYCQTLSEDLFAVGLKFDGDWDSEGDVAGSNTSLL